MSGFLGQIQPNSRGHAFCDPIKSGEIWCNSPRPTIPIPNEERSVWPTFQILKKGYDFACVFQIVMLCLRRVKRFATACYIVFKRNYVGLISSTNLRNSSNILLLGLDISLVLVFESENPWQGGPPIMINTGSDFIGSVGNLRISSQNTVAFLKLRRYDAAACGSHSTA